MKKYNDIGDLYRERFSNYTPDVPNSVWEGVQSTMKNKPSLWNKLKVKLAVSAGAIVVISAIAYLFVAPEIESDETATLSATSKVENKNAGSKEVVTKDIVEGSKQENEYTHKEVYPKNVSTPQNNVNTSEANNNPINENLAQHSSSEKIEQVSSDNKKVNLPTNTSTSTEQSQEKNPSKAKTDENISDKKSPIVSNNTSVEEEEQYRDKVNTEIHIPNAFTPNGDGLNDFFFAKTDMELQSFEMTIYSADGRQVLFNSKDINRGWDGTYRGQLQEHGVYYYTIRCIDNFGKKFEKRGELLLMRF